MTVLSKASCQALFETGDRPTQQDFTDLIDSYQDINSNLTTLSSASLGGFGLVMLATNTTAAAQNLLGVTAPGTVGAQLIAASTTAQALNVLGGTTGTGTIVLTSAPTIYQPNLVGTTTNNNANSGSVGEIISSSVASSTVTLSTGVAANATSIALTAGDWDIGGVVSLLPDASTSISVVEGAISDTSATFPSTTTLVINTPVTQIRSASYTPGANSVNIPIAQGRVSIAASANYYLLARAAFATSGMRAGGIIWARRAR